MSLSNRPAFPRAQPVTAWALEELDMPDIFEMRQMPEPGPELAATPESGGREHGAEQELALAQQLKHVEAAAYERGRTDGTNSARAELVPRVETAASALACALEAVEAQQARWTSNAEENLAVLAVAVARQLIAREVEGDPTIVAGLVQRALSQFPLEQPVTVRLHPDDVDASSELLQPAEGNKFHELRWIADAHVVRGGCIVEGRERIVDGRVDTALERIYRAIGNVQA